MDRRARQRVVPHLGYEDPFAALAWLCRVFEFTEVKRFDRGGAAASLRSRRTRAGETAASVRPVGGSIQGSPRTALRPRCPRVGGGTGRCTPRYPPGRTTSGI